VQLMDNTKPQRPQLGALYAAAAALVGTVAKAGVLPDDRADVLYHSYSGGGVTINGESVLVRKKIGDHVSLVGNWFTDTVSGASIDVVTQASAYKEKRNQESLGVDLLLGKTTYSAGYINSDESDFKSKTAFITVSEDMFGDLTTISFGAVRGWDKNGKSGNAITGGDIDRRNWQLSLTQILSRNLLLGLNYETSESEGFLNNPYRKVRFRFDQADCGCGYDTQNEVYPHTRTGNAGSVQLKYHLPGRGALDGSYRYYGDTWGIRAHTGQLGVTQPVFHNWLLDGHVRYYRQTRANFYSDLFPFESAQNFMARDRELATFKSLTLGVGASWQFHVPHMNFLQKNSLNLRVDRLRINYDDYRNLQVKGLAAGTEPLYTLDATVFQVFYSGWF